MRGYTDLLLGFSGQLGELMQLHADLQVYLGSGRWTRTLAASMRAQISNNEPSLANLQTLRALLLHLQTLDARLQEGDRNLSARRGRFADDRNLSRERSRSRDRSRGREQQQN